MLTYIEIWKIEKREFGNKEKKMKEQPHKHIRKINKKQKHKHERTT